ncbi:TonB-dependent receptor [Solimicrobium silvestre]|uniref:TonB dependent receptor n=1 Tax=Solimicrobium silvestre TaxID=2099400 RepID=A0A2S9H2L2_9BURK|nr:TonB-dependent receptor [Solimicrobium silvestre]PRC94183.1 TonB dependent receptor [Solimicrobium silvestre]
MIKEKNLSRSMRSIFSSGIALGMGVLGGSALAQEAEVVQRVEITGSSIKRMASETALPITIIKADTFVKQGLTTAEDVLNSLGSNQSSSGGSQSVGSGSGGKSSADLRGIGTNKTLILLNGRRLANHPYDGSSVDLNIIPVGALDRVEVLRDGASAIYGTDAIGGVINFITKRSVKGVEVTGEGVNPQHKGGGEARFNLLAGIGDLEEDGFNVFGVFDWHKQNALKATDRDFSATGIIPNRGLNKMSGNTGSANFYDPISGLSGNMSRAAGCNPAQNSYIKNATSCGYDYTADIDDIPQTEQWSFLGKASYKLNADNVLTLEYLHSDSTNIGRVAPTPFYTGSGSLPGLNIDSNSPFYPGNGITPAYPGLSGGPLDLNWRSMDAGQRREKDKSKTDRFLIGAEGLLAGWDYKTGFMYAQSKATTTLTNGYLKDSGVLAGITGGIINPFGPQNAAGLAYLDSIALNGELYSGTTKRTGIDFTASREFGRLAGGAMGVAIGTEFAHESAAYTVNRSVADQASATGGSDAQNVSGARNISALFGEFTAPVTKELEVQLAARYDYYSDVGGTFNPKIGIRYQPAKELLLRASANTGFRAPTLFEKFSPDSTTNTANTYNDPALCPGGTALPGQNPSLVCNAQQQIRGGGSANLAPEKAKNFSVGFVYEPNSAMTFSADYWNLRITDSIGTLPETVIFGNPTKYADLFVRNPDGSLKYVLATNANLGGINTDGIDASMTLRLPKTSLGNFVVNLDGTYVNQYKYQNEKDGAWTQNVGTYADNSPVFRWKHTLSLMWTKNVWSTTLSQQFMTGYHDQNQQVAAQYYQDVSSYSIWNLTGTYSGFKNVTLTAGLKNLFDKNPPFTNQGTTFQQGYDPRFTNPVGRALYLRGTYRF